jgi:hypothetical protein
VIQVQFLLAVVAQQTCLASGPANAAIACEAMSIKAKTIIFS